MIIILTPRRVIRNLLLFLFLLSGLAAVAQSDTISAVTNTDAEHLVRDIFLGGGECFEVFNIQLSGQSGQAGVFTNGAASIGFADGIILSNGSVDNISGPNTGHELGDPATLSTGYGVSTTDSDLATLSMLEGDNNSNFFDPVVLEFDFTPTLDSISFEFIFASEEYCQFSLSSFIDLFGFFISGPGITGPYTNNGINIAVVPGTNQAITARSISPFFNNSFYQNNIPPGQLGCSLNQPAPSSGFNAFDGFTVPLVAKAQVIPCETYHLKLVVSDRGFDDQLDAAVFLRANSFAAGLTSRIASQITDGPNMSNDTSYEGCGSADIIFTRGDSVLTNDLTVYYNLLGNSTATPGLDYTPLPDSVVIPAGVFADTVTIDFLADGIPEGTEFFTIELRNPCDCSASELTISILDPVPLLADIVGADTICSGDGLTLAAVPTSSTGTISYAWENGDVDSIFNVLPLTNDTFQLTITDECDNSVMLEHSVHVQSPTATLDGSFTICEGQSFVTLPITLTDGDNFTFDFLFDGVPTTYTDIPAGVFQIPVTTTGVYEITNLSADGCQGTSVGVADVLALDITTTAQVDSIACFNDSNGSIELFPVGGNAPYSYTWSHQSGLDTNLVEDLDVGIYDIFISDEIGCLDTISVTLDQPDLLEIEIDTLNLFADCSMPGSLQGQASGGVAPYSFSWSNGGTQALNDELTDGVYTLSVTDANNCLQTLTTEIQGDSLLPMVAIEALDSLDCETSSIVLDAGMSTQNGNLTYTWTNSAGTTLPTSNPLLLTVSDPDVYTLTILNNDNGCESSASIIVDFNAAELAVSIGGQAELDCIQGAIELFANGADPGWTIDWEAIDGTSLATNSPTFIVNSAGTYVLLATQANSGCTGRDTVTINADLTPPVSGLVAPPDSLNCNNNQVNIDTDILAGSGNYTFSWTGPAGGLGSAPTLEDLTATEPGDYQLVTQDLSNGCSDTLMIEVIENLIPPSIAPLSDTVLDCNTSLIELTASSSTSGNLTFNWEDATGMSISSMASVQLTTPGTYVVEFAQIDNGCTGSETVVVTEDFAAPTVSLDGVLDNLNCNNNQVNIDTDVLAGSGNYTFSWTGPAGGLGSDPTLEDLTATEPGDYQLVTQDLSNGCSDTLTVEIIENLIPPSIAPLSDTVLDCNTSLIELTASSSTSGNLTFNWEDATGMSISSMASVQLTTPGTYVVELTQIDNGCTGSETVIVTEDFAAPTVSLNGVLDNLNCNNNQVNIDTDVLAGSGNYTFSWTGPAGGLGSDPTLEDLTATEPGDYQLVTQDLSNGCSDTLMIEVIENLTALSINALPDTLLDCNTDLIELTASSPAPGNLEFTWVNAAGMPISNIAMVELSEPGTYVVQITQTDSGCTGSETVIVTGDFAAPDVNLNGTPDSLDCDVSQVDIFTTTSGSGMYTYQWTGPAGGLDGDPSLENVSATQAGTYQLITQDLDNGCRDTLFTTIIENPGGLVINPLPDTLLTCYNSTLELIATSPETGDVSFSWQNPLGVTISNTATAMISAAGVYTVRLENADSTCFQTTEVVVDIDSVAPLVTPVLPGDLNCEDSTLTLSTSPGLDNYVPTWRNAMGVILPSISWSQDVTQAGGYSLTVRDTVNGCVSTILFEVGTDTVAPIINLNPLDSLTCATDTVQINPMITNGSGNYLYQWNGPLGGIVGATDIEDIEVITGGSYTLMVTDQNNGCTDTLASQVIVNRIAPVLDMLDDPVLNCYQTSVIISGSSTSTGSLNYQWLNQSGDILSNNANLEITGMGNYELQLVNMDNGCSDALVIAVTEDFTAPQVEAGADGIIGCETTTATLNGQEGPVNWLPVWLDANGTPVSTRSWTLTTSLPGTYDLLVTDTLNGCTATDQATIDTDQSAPSAEAGPSVMVLDCFTGNAVIDLRNSTQGPAITYTLVDENGIIVEESTTPTFTIATPGNYQVIVTDTDNECQAIDTFSLTSEEPSIDALITNDVSCGEETGSIVFEQVSNGSTPYLYSIDGGATFVSENVFLNLEVGSYDLVVQDMNGCETQAATAIAAPNTFEIILPEQVFLKLGDTYQLDPIFDRTIDQLLRITWSNDPQLSCTDCLEPVFAAEQTTFLELTLVDIDGCTSTAIVLMVVDQTVPIYTPNVFSPNNRDGVNDSFTIYGDPGQIEQVEMLQIYDRWGSVLFSKTQFPINDPNEGWDGTVGGKVLNRGVFVYWAEVLLRNGERVIVEGDVLIVE